jgi:4-hydroxybenzoate polyprenyltransferase
MANNRLRSNFASVVLPLCLSLAGAGVYQLVSHTSSPYLFHATAALGLFCLLLNFLYANLTGKSNFTGALLVGTVVKLVAAMVWVFVYSVLWPASFFVFAIQFICIYLIFTAFELVYIIHLIKSQQKS